MADIICVKCTVKMRKERSGLKILLPNDYCQRGDLYRCPTCQTEVLGDLDTPSHDRNPRRRGDYSLRRDHRR